MNVASTSALPHENLRFNPADRTLKFKRHFTNSWFATGMGNNNCCKAHRPSVQPIQVEVAQSPLLVENRQCHARFHGLEE